MMRNLPSVLLTLAFGCARAPSPSPAIPPPPDTFVPEAPRPVASVAPIEIHAADADVVAVAVVRGGLRIAGIFRELVDVPVRKSLANGLKVEFRTRVFVYERGTMPGNPVATRSCALTYDFWTQLFAATFSNGTIIRAATLENVIRGCPDLGALAVPVTLPHGREYQVMVVAEEVRTSVALPGVVAPAGITPTPKARATLMKTSDWFLVP